jgi:predicted regulator of Ras-like GTPase activity (Roadblock/LC7/MglB family)
MVLRRLEAIIEPYLDIAGIDSAALVSRDGLLVAATGDCRLDLEAVAAYTATTISAADELWSQLESGRRRFVSLDLVDNGLVIAAVTDDILLVLIGQKRSIRSLIEQPVAV